MKATEQYFPLMLFIMLYKVVLTFKSGDSEFVFAHLSSGKEYISHVSLIQTMLKTI